MKKVTKIVAYSVVLICCCVGASVIATNLVNKKNNKVVYVSEPGAPYSTLPSAYLAASGKMQPVDLTEAAEKTVHGVVHIKSTVKSRTQTYQEMPEDRKSVV